MNKNKVYLFIAIISIIGMFASIPLFVFSKPSSVLDVVYLLMFGISMIFVFVGFMGYYETKETKGAIK